MRFDGIELTSDECFNRASDLLRSIGSIAKPTRIEVKVFSTAFALVRTAVVTSGLGGNFIDLANPNNPLMTFGQWLTYVTKSRSLMVGNLRFRFIVSSTTTGAGTYDGDVGYSKFTGNTASVTSNVFPAMKRRAAAIDTVWDNTTLFSSPDEIAFTTLNITDTVAGFTNLDVVYFFDFDGYIINF